MKLTFGFLYYPVTADQWPVIVETFSLQYKFFLILMYLLSKWGNLKKDPKNKGKVMNKGFWRYTRHPNYFGDATLWWGFFLMALGYPQGYFFIFSQRTDLAKTAVFLQKNNVFRRSRPLKMTKINQTSMQNRCSKRCCTNYEKWCQNGVQDVIWVWFGPPFWA